MDWKTASFDWNHARAFLVTAEEGSFSAAARALGATQPTVGRQVDALEAELGVALFERVGRGLALTASGVELVELARQMQDAATRFSRVASGQSQSIEGAISLTASAVISAHLLPPVLEELRAEHPGVEVKLVATNTIRDLRRREADIAIRSGKPTDPDLVATRLRDTPAHLYATPAYLKRIGRPKTPDELSRADFVGFTDDDRFMDGLNQLGFRLTSKNFPLHTPDHLVLWELVKSGLGVGAIIAEVGDAEPRVTRALPSMPPIPVPMWLVAHREVHTSRRVRVVFDLLASRLRYAAPPTTTPAAGSESPTRGRRRR